MQTISSVFSNNAPTPAGHYSQATVYNGVVYVAGQLPIDADGNKMVNASVADQARQTLMNVKAILEAANSGLDRVLQMTIYVSDVSQWGEVNNIFAEMMGDHKPARAIVPVKELNYGLTIEIQTIAAVRG